MSHQVVILHPNGRLEPHHLPHDTLYTFFEDNIHFCGAIDDALAFGVARDRAEDVENVFAERFPALFTSTKGPIVLVGSDEDGLACDVDVDLIRRLLRYD